MARILPILVVLLVPLVVVLVVAAQEDCVHTTVDLTTGAPVRFSRLAEIAATDPAQDIVLWDTLDATSSVAVRICDGALRDAATWCPTAGAGTAACEALRSADGGGDRFEPLGTEALRVILDHPSGDRARGVLVHFSNGSVCADGERRRRLLLTIDCDPYGTTPVSAIRMGNRPASMDGSARTEPCDYQAWMSSVYACPDVSDFVCTALADCASCSAAYGCGWCSATQACLAGGEYGPYNGQCVVKEWHFSAAVNPCVNCTALTQCGQCTAQSDCKYCTGSSTPPSCQPLTAINCANPTRCSCPACGAAEYCPANGGACLPLPVCNATLLEAAHART